jgi:hypothetical protein
MNGTEIQGQDQENWLAASKRFSGKVVIYITLFLVLKVVLYCLRYLADVNWRLDGLQELADAFSTLLYPVLACAAIYWLMAAVHTQREQLNDSRIARNAADNQSGFARGREKDAMRLEALKALSAVAAEEMHSARSLLLQIDLHRPPENSAEAQSYQERFAQDQRDHAAKIVECDQQLERHKADIRRILGRYS